MGLQHIIDWFTGGSEQYINTIDSMKQDTLWVWITIILHLLVFIGYLFIAFHWYKSQKGLQACRIKQAIWRMTYIFIIGSMCGYLMVVVKMFWPAWRLSDIIMVPLIWFIYRYITGSSGLVAFFNQMGLLDQLKIDLAALQMLNNNIPQMVCVTSATGELESVNSQWVKYTGLTLDQSKIGWKNIIHPSDLTKTLELWTNSLSSGNFYENECRIKSSDGTYRWHIDRAIPTKGIDGKINNWYRSCTDIEAQKALEQKLQIEKENLTKLRQLTKNMFKTPSKPSKNIKRHPRRKPI